MSHEPGQAVANFTISLSQSVDVCSLYVRISAGNSAGTSAPSEAVEVGMSATVQVFKIEQHKHVEIFVVMFVNHTPLQ